MESSDIQYFGAFHVFPIFGFLGKPRPDGRSGRALSFPTAKTIDVTFLNLLSMSGGLSKETAELLKEQGKYEEFMTIMNGEYQETFGGTALREPTGFALPKAPAPSILEPYAS